MKLNLKRPLAFFDLEATGINVASDRIVEISILKAMPSGNEEIKTLKIKPLIPIPLESSLIHGIYDEDVIDSPTFKDVAQEIIDFLADADLAGYNSNKFDIPMLLEEFLRVGINFEIEHRKFVDVQNIFHQMEQRTLRAAYKFYCGKDIINAHYAEADIKATYEVLLSQIEKYEGKDWENKKGVISQPVKNDVDSLHTFTNLNKPVDFAGRMIFNDENLPIFNFGKHKGKTLFQVFDEEPSYYSWMMNGDFPLYTKNRLDKFWQQHKEKRNEARQKPRPVEIQQKPKPVQQQKPLEPQKPKEEEVSPANDDMLKMLANKFKKI